MEDDNLMIDFTGVYRDRAREEAGLVYLDFTDIAGTDMYCTAEAERIIKRRLDSHGVSGIHFLDSGNYHYMTKFFMDAIGHPFSLVLFDFHNDMQRPMIPGILSCGGWAKDALCENPNLRQLILIGPDAETIDEIAGDKSRLVCISAQELAIPAGAGSRMADERDPERAQVGVSERLAHIDFDVPMYLSVDKDVLAKEYAVTNWNQGELTLDALERLLSVFLQKSHVIGVDICGEYSAAGGGMPDYAAAEAINEQTNRELYHFLCGRF